MFVFESPYLCVVFDRPPPPNPPGQRGFKSDSVALVSFVLKFSRVELIANGLFCAFRERRVQESVQLGPGRQESLLSLHRGLRLLPPHAVRAVQVLDQQTHQIHQQIVSVFRAQEPKDRNVLLICFFSNILPFSCAGILRLLLNFRDCNSAVVT